MKAGVGSVAVGRRATARRPSSVVHAGELAPRARAGDAANAFPTPPVAAPAETERPFFDRLHDVEPGLVRLCVHALTAAVDIVSAERTCKRFATLVKACDALAGEGTIPLRRLRGPHVDTSFGHARPGRVAAWL